MHKMTLEGFRNWLGTLPPATKFDMHSSSACVVASYYQSVYPHACVKMSGSYAVDIDGVGGFIVPRWAVDLQYAYYPPTTRHNRFATPNQVLQTLDALTSAH